VISFNDTFVKTENVKDNTVEGIFKNEPTGGTTLAPALQAAFDEHFAKASDSKKEGTTILVVTDGEPTDKPEVTKTIIAAANRLGKDEELAVSFIQVGQDEKSRDYLKSLDDDLTKQGAKFDIVDTLTMQELGTKTLAEVLTAAVQD